MPQFEMKRHFNNLIYKIINTSQKMNFLNEIKWMHFVHFYYLFIITSLLLFATLFLLN